MSVSTALVTQYYEGILRQTPSEATVTQLANLPNLSALITNLLGTADVSVDPILRLYQAAFGRVPDTQGLTNMVGVYKYNAQGTGTLTLAQMAGQFTGSPEFLNLYGAQTTNHASNVQFVSALYVNVLNRAMVGTEGDGWIALLDAGGSRTTTLTGFSESTEFQVATNGAVNNFLTSAGALTNSYSSNLFYYGDASAANTHELTVGTDIINGGAGYNVFEAGLSNGGSGSALYNTLENSDRLTGGSGVNTINVVLTASGTAVTPTALNQIQNVNVQNEGAAILDLTNSNAVVNVTVHDNAGLQIINNIQSADVNFAVVNSAFGATFDVAAAAVAGTSDNAVLTVKGVSAGAIGIDAGYETLTINSVNYSATNTSNVIKTEFAGDITLQDLGQASGGAVSNTLSGTASATDIVNSNNIDATGLSGTLTAYLTGGTTFVGGDGDTTLTSGGGVNSFTFGNGDNTLNISALSMVSNATTVAGGAGVDTLTMSAQLDAASDTADANFATMSDFDTFKFVGNQTNALTIGTEFVDTAGFTNITAAVLTGTSSNYVTAANVDVTGLTFTGTTGTMDTFTFSNTASGTLTVSGVEVVDLGDNPGNAAQTINIANNTGATSVTLGTGADAVNILANDGVSVTVSGVDIVNATLASNTGNTVILGDNTTAVTINGGAGVLTVNANAVSTAATTINFGDSANTLIVAALNAVSNATSIVGGSGVDTLTMSAQLNSGADANFATMSGFDTFKFVGNQTNAVTIGTEFVDTAGFTNISAAVLTGTSSNYVTAANVDVTGLTFTGTAGTMDTFTFSNTASGTLTIAGVEFVESGSNEGNAAQSIILGGTTAQPSSIGISLGGGTDGVVNTNTNDTTVVLTGVETYLGSVGTDVISMAGNLITINGGGGTDTVTLGLNTSNVTILAGDGALMTVTGNTASTADALNIGAAGTYNLNNVETVTLSSAAADATLNALLTSRAGAATAGVTIVSTYTLADGNIATFDLAGGTATGGTIYLTVDAAENGIITFDTPVSSELTAGVLISTQDVGYTDISLMAGVLGAGTSNDVITTNLGGLTSGNLTADSFVISNFGAAGSDDVDLSGLTLVSAIGGTKNLQTTYLNSSGFQDQDSFTAAGLFVSGNSSTLANISTGSAQNGLIFQFNMGSTTADFSTQAGIDTAVTWLTGTIGSSASLTQTGVISVASGASGAAGAGNALFLYTADGTAGIDASDLKLIGVANGTLSVNTFS